MIRRPHSGHRRRSARRFVGGKLGSGAVAATDKNVSFFSGLRHPAASPAKRAGARLEVRSTAVSAYAGSSVQLAADAQFLCIPRTLFNKFCAVSGSARSSAILDRIFIRKAPAFWVYLGSFVIISLPIAFLAKFRHKICRFVTIFASILSKNPAPPLFYARNSTKDAQ